MPPFTEISILFQEQITWLAPYFYLLNPIELILERFQDQCQTNAPGEDARYLAYESSRSTACL